MNVGEWPLIIFTILAQMSVGTFCLLGLAHWYARAKAGPDVADRLSTFALLAIGPTLVLGLLASMFHMGNPLNAPKVILNIGSSWLSREIFFGLAFAGLGAVFAFLQWRKIGSQTLRSILAVVTALVGLALVYSMAKAYMTPAQPVWNTPATVIRFFTTTFLLGSLALGCAMLVGYQITRKKNADCDDQMCAVLRDVIRWIAVLAIVLLGVELIVMPLYMGQLAGSGIPQAMRAVGALFNQYALLLAIELIAVFIGAGVFGLLVYRASRDSGVGSLASLIIAAFVLVLASEVIGRFLFYAVHFRVGLA